MKIVTAAVLSAALTASSLSNATGFDRDRLREYMQNLQEKYQNSDRPTYNQDWRERCKDRPVPELDAGAAGLGLGLVLGMGALVRERRNRRK